MSAFPPHEEERLLKAAALAFPGKSKDVQRRNLNDWYGLKRRALEVENGMGSMSPAQQERLKRLDKLFAPKPGQ
ncbi:MAG: hypothetical protein OXT65_02380 [Alphaproteobacteria bacterium]|nr:hypothetical protein [Alphaproteobacteria bacterium]